MGRTPTGSAGSGAGGAPTRAERRSARRSTGSEPSVLPLPGLPVLRVGGTTPRIVAADVHLGLGSTLDRGPRPPEGLPGPLAEGLLHAARIAGSRELLLLGDVKDPIRGVPRHLRWEIAEFFRALGEGGLRTEVVLGNHDVGLPSWLPPDVTVHAPRGLLREGVGYFHGHAWPSDQVLRRARVLVVGHLHPGFRLAPAHERGALGKERCWVRAVFPRRRPREARRRRTHPLPRAAEMVVIPAYNPLCANEALNREEPRRGRRFLVRRFLARGDARAYLLDGTDVGPLAWGATREGPGPS